MSLSTPTVGNDFLLARPQLQAATPVVTPEPALAMPISTAQLDPQSPEILTNPSAPSSSGSPFGQLFDLLHRYTFLTFAVLILLVGTTGVEVAGRYWAAHVAAENAKSHPASKAIAPAISGLNLEVPAHDIEATLQTVTNQAATLALGEKNIAISPDIIRSWLQVTTSTDKSTDYVHVKTDSIAASLTQLASKSVKAPTNQVTVTHDGTSSVVIAGRDGTALEDPATLQQQAQQIAKTVMDAKGLQFSTPLKTVPFQAVTPAAFTKLIEVNVVTKQMYLYDNGQLTRSYPISAGAPATPTPLGEYKIYSKLPVQDMKGFNANGTKYFQPHVRWINYFLPGGYAVHGVYWHGSSWFGNINSSHGCVGLPEDQAKWVYDWAPIGTTVINHT